MRTAWAVAFGVVCGLLAAGLILLVSRTPRGDPVTLYPPPSPEPLVVHVAGAVYQPGVYTLPYGARVKDAVEAAAGFTEQADVNAVNQAAILQDGQRVFIPGKPTEPAMSSGNDASAAPVGLAYPIDINLADQTAFESLPGIGPVTAQAILKYRLEHGHFASIEEIVNVPGIGPVTFENIRDLIMVNP
jgi:competence protein ComEA